MFYDSLHVIVIMPNTAEDALNAFENRCNIILLSFFNLFNIIKDIKKNNS